MADSSEFPVLNYELFRDRVSAFPTHRAESIALTLIVLQHVAAQGVTFNDLERHLWVILLYRLMCEVVTDK